MSWYVSGLFMYVCGCTKTYMYVRVCDCMFQVYTCMYKYVQVCTKTVKYVLSMYENVPRNSMRHSDQAPSIDSRTDLPPVANLAFVSHTMGVKPGLAMALRIGLVAKHRTGLSRGRSSRPSMLCRTCLPALKFSGTGSSKSLTSASSISQRCLGMERSARLYAGSHNFECATNK